MGKIPEKTFWNYLFRPFHFVAGTKALLIGGALLLATAGISSLVGMHVDGVLDAHFGQGNFLTFLLEGVINVVAMTAVLSIAGLIVAKSRFRLIDILGTQSLARGPVFLVAISGLFTPYEKIQQYFLHEYLKMGDAVEVSTMEWVFLGISALMLIGVIVWMIALMWQGFKISCNVSGGKAVIAFIIALLIAEGISKLAIAGLISLNL